MPDPAGRNNCGGPMGACTTLVKSSKNSKSTAVGTDDCPAKGNEDSSKTT